MLIEPVSEHHMDGDKLDSLDSDEEMALLPNLTYRPCSPSSSSTARASTTVVGSATSSAHANSSKLSAASFQSLDEPVGVRTHRPISVSALFKPGALPLVIAHLDNYLEALPPVVFTPAPFGGGRAFQSRSKPSKAEREEEVRRQDGMFPPLERLEGGFGVHKYLWNRVGKKRARFAWARPSVLADMIASLAVGIEGSAGVSSLYSLENAYAAVQVVALILTSVATLGQSDKVLSGWRKLFLGDVPNMVALNFPSVFGQSIILLLVYQALALLLLWAFHREVKAAGSPNDVYEGFTAMRWTGWSRARRARVLLCAFGLIVLYIPMSTMAVRALVWSSDFWPLDVNPYLTTDEPDLPPDLVFCYTTTSTGGANWAPFIIVASAVSFCAITVYFPLRLYWTIKANLPHVDRYTELGRRRGAQEEDREYRRLLERDDNPLAFLYKGYRRRWGAYRAYYIVMKLSVLVVVAFVSKDNCVFSRTAVPRAMLEVIQQGVLLFFLSIWLAVQIALKPFNDSNGNASEIVSRGTYIAMTLVGLLAALGVPGSAFLESYVLYMLMVISYAGNIWYGLIAFDFAQRFIQRYQKRLDWSIDLFSPHVDVEPWQSIHVKRRVWQETLSTILLTDESLRMPTDKDVVYSEARSGRWPPYLINFQNAVGERHAENLKILREIGSSAYYDALNDGKQKHWDALRDATIPVGPDCFYQPSRGPFPTGVTTWFGNAWVVPHPLTLVIRFDQCRTPYVLTEIGDIETYIEQNARSSTDERRMLRAVLRSLEGQTVRWPYTTVAPARRGLLAATSDRRAAPVISTYPSGVLEIQRQGSLPWKGLELGSGFVARVRYSKNVYAGAGHIGLSDDFALNDRLAAFLERNADLVDRGLPAVLDVLDDYRSTLAFEARRKTATMSYGFLRDVYDKLPMTAKETEFRLREGEANDRLRTLVADHPDAFRAVFERLHGIFRSRATCLWYLFWDDLWRRNHATIALLRTHRTVFSPAYPTSIAYRPCSRSKLVTFLAEHELWPAKGKRGFFGDHVLNLLYWAVNEVQFDDVPVHFGSSSTCHVLSSLEHAAAPSTFSTGAATLASAPGTDYSASLLLPRPAFEWEGAYLPAQTGLGPRLKGWLAGLLGLGRYDGPRPKRAQLALDVELQEGERGRYVPLDGRDEP